MVTDCDLATHLGAMAAALPCDLVDPDEFVIARSDLASVPRQMVTSSLVICKRAAVAAPTFRVDDVYFHATNETMRQLGLLVLASAFLPDSGEDAIEVRLAHPASDVKIVRMEAWGPAVEGLRFEPTSFAYWVSRPERHPWDRHPPADPMHLPWVGLDWAEGTAGWNTDWSTRDLLIGFGSRIATALFAELLLNAGNPENPDNEYRLEGPGGFRGVADHSAQISLWLPGSLAWDCSHGLD